MNASQNYRVSWKGPRVLAVVGLWLVLMFVLASCPSAGAGGGGGGGGGTLTQAQKGQAFEVVVFLVLAATLGGEVPGVLEIDGDTFTYTDLEYDPVSGATVSGTISDSDTGGSTGDVDINLALTNDPDGVNSIIADFSYDDSGQTTVATGTFTVNGETFPAQEFYDAIGGK